MIHTPEPWRWEYNAKNKSVLLVGGKPQFDKTVMQFSRWGMHGAGPMFNAQIAGNLWNVMERLCDKPEWIAPFEGRNHHADWCANVTHPDARRIVACVNALENVSTEWLEQNKSIVVLGSPIADRFREIEKQRDELLAVAELCQKAGLHKHVLNTGETLAAFIDAAIASAKGGAA